MANMQERVEGAVATARETAGNIGEKVSDFFQGNPFETPVGRKIEMATDASQLATENWGLNMEICDYINHTQNGGKDAIRAIRKRLHTQMSKNNAVVMYTLTVLETCVKNCDHRFHALVCQKDFIQDLVKLIGPRFDAPQIVQERVLSLIQAWTDAFRGQPDLIGVIQVYDDLKSKGVEFPAADLDTLAPIITPQRTVFPEPSPPQPTVQSAAAAPVNPEQYQQPMQVDPSRGVRASNDELSKLRSELDIVNSNIKVFREMLTETSPGQATADELQLLKELDETCREMQKRVLSLIAYLTNDEVINELLVVNDELNSTFEKYGRFLQNRELEVSGKSAQVQADREKSAKDLIDLDGPTPAGGASSSGSSAPSAPADSYTVDQRAKMSYEEIKRLGLQPLPIHLENLSLGDRPSGSSYAANVEPQAEVGLRTAAHNKTTPVDEREAKEMEQWLSAQEEAKPKSKDDVENEKL